MLVNLWGHKVKIHVHHLQNINLVSFSHNKPKLLNTVNKTKTKKRKNKLSRRQFIKSNLG